MDGIVGNSSQITLAITFDPSTGSVGVGGPVDNLVLCFGMLEAAKVTLVQRAQENERRVKPVSILPQGLTS